MPRKIHHFVIVAAFLCAFFAILTDRHDSSSISSYQSSTRRSGAIEALDFWTLSRAYPNNDIPQDKYLQEYHASKLRLREVLLKTGTSTSWEPIGPLNVVGRAVSVAVNPLNPNTVYVGTASGGLWRSHRGTTGGDWQRITTGYPVLGIMAIAIDPSDSNTIYIGTGEVYRYQGSIGGTVIRTTRGSFGMGILKTTDGGATWARSLDWSYSQQRGVEAIRINPLNHNTLFAATTEGIYRTTNAGGTWDLVWPVLMGEDIIIKTNDTNFVMASCGNFSSAGAGIYLSADGGTNWFPLGGGLPTFSGKTLLEIYAAIPNIVYASIADSTTGTGGLWRTTNFGTGWTLVNGGSIFGVQGWYSHFVAVHPTDSSQIVHGAVSIFKSTNGGTSFFGSSGTWADHHNYAHDPTDPNILYVVDDGGVWRSTDFGATFFDVSFGMQTTQFYNGFSNSATDSLLALGQVQDHFGWMYRGSMTWVSSGADEVGWTAINQVDDHIMYADTREGGTLEKSNDRGATFATIASFAGLGSWNSPFVLSPSNTSILYFGKTKIFKSTTAGASWSATNNNLVLDGNPALSMAISSTNPNIVFVGTAPYATRAHVFRTTDGGTSWTNVTGTLPDRYPNDIAVDPESSPTVYAVFGGFGAGHVFKSSDTGATWVDITGTLADVPTSAVIVDPLNSDHIYIGNDIGVYLSTNGGINWASFSGGLPEAIIAADLTITPSNRTLRVATHGNGVYQRKLLYTQPTYVTSTLESFPNVITPDSILAFKAIVNNSGLEPQIDTVRLKVRILDKAATEIYSDSKFTCCLSPGESREVQFDGSFVPPDTGDYNLEFIKSGTSVGQSQDTARSLIRVLLPAPITYSIVTKDACAYEEIIGGTVLPAGDDVQATITLPFMFTYDNYQYNLVQVSTNGWVEFGIGATGSLRGLSSSGQIGPIGANENGRLFGTSRPNKVLGPWWEDMNTDVANDPTASLSYKTLGSTPDRVFVIQWKSFLAYYDPATTTTRVNFQVRLHESSNIIEFHYGQVQVGTFAGTDTGAMVGFKDHIGGDYRYYDISRGGSGPISQGNTHLSPLTNWPGADSCYRINTNPNLASAFIHVNPQWNLISTPFDSSLAVSDGFPTAIGGTTFEYDTGYVTRDTLLPGKGYWTKFPEAFSRILLATQNDSLSIMVKKGWNLIGSVDHEVSAPSGGIIASYVFGYSNGYQISTTIKPGKGYFVKADTSGAITLGTVAQPKLTVDSDGYNSITITDNRGRTQTLYVAEDIDGKIQLNRYEMPPLPPAGDFDARFASNRMLEAYRSEIKDDVEYPILLQSPEYPLAIHYEIKAISSRGLVLEEVQKGKVIEGHSLSGKGHVVLARDEESQLVLKVFSDTRLPKHFALSQNYPNPFNPITRITFDVPHRTHAVLSVYNILGQLVTTLADGEYEPGSHEVVANLGNVGSGVYLYRLRAGTFTEVRKMILAK